MKKFTLILFVVAFCIYIYHCKPELVARIIKNEGFENEGFENLDLNLKDDPVVNMVYEAHNNANNKYHDINNENYGLLDNGFINKKYNKMITDKELGNDIINKDDINNQETFEDSKDNDDVYPYKSYVYNNNTYQLFGLASNSYYNIYYIIYEREMNKEQSSHNNKLYEYILIKKIKNKINVIQIFQPRNKITMGEYINVYSGPYELSHILVSPIN